MKITEFNKSNLKELRISLNEILKAFEAKHGLNVEFGTISFSGQEFTTKLKVKTNSPKIKSETTPSKVGNVYKLKNTYYKITSMFNKGKYSISAVTHKGKFYSLKPDFILRGILISNQNTIDLYFPKPRVVTPQNCNPSEPKSNDKMKTLLNNDFSFTN